ncbi:MAG: hypothetical protein H6831_15595 [Planctomycetes bacterium]|nr:hypothetical protein [Planctomycetota bacterium]MCB9905822.1 hypothetical protein [Planctomycetota bacterium]
MTDLQSTAELASESGRKGPLGRLLAGVVYWMPVWVPLGVLAQLGVLGLKPALREDRRLAQAEIRLEERLHGLREERDELRQQLDSFSDPIFRERLRRIRDAE